MRRMASGQELSSTSDASTRPHTRGFTLRGRDRPYRHRSWWGASMFAVMSLSSSFVAAPVGSQRSALPELKIEDLPKAVRIQLQEAYDSARTAPNDAGAAGRLGMLLHAYDQHRSALSCYEVAHALDPRVFSWTYLRGVEEAALGDYTAAARSLRTAVTIDPDYLPARIRLADVLMATGDLDGSRMEYTALAREAPELAAAHYGLGRLSALRRESKAAVEHYRRAVDISPQFGTAHYALALAYRDVGLDDLAERHAAQFRRWGARRPSPPDPILESVVGLKNTARALLATAAQRASAGRLQEAIDLHLQALAIDSRVAQAHVNLISLYGRAGRVAEAESHYRAALAFEGNGADAHYNYGVLLVSTGRPRDAIDAFRKALDLHPFHAQAHNNLATLLAASGSLEEAVSHYRQATANDPMHRSARFLLVRALLNLGRLAEAAEQSERLPRWEGADTARLWFMLANAWLKVQDGGRARACAEEALRRAKAAGQTELTSEIARQLARMTATR